MVTASSTVLVWNNDKLKKARNYSCAPASAAKGQIWLQYWCRNDTEFAFFHVRKSFPWCLVQQMQLQMLPIPVLVWHSIWPIFVNSFVNHKPRFFRGCWGFYTNRVGMFPLNTLNCFWRKNDLSEIRIRPRNLK